MIFGLFLLRYDINRGVSSFQQLDHAHSILLHHIVCMMVQRQRVRVGSAYSEEFEVKVGVNQGSVLSPLLFAIVEDFITENARRNVVNK